VINGVLEVSVCICRQISEACVYAVGQMQQDAILRQRVMEILEAPANEL
jgi:hypothetical protein